MAAYRISKRTREREQQYPDSVRRFFDLLLLFSQAHRHQKSADTEATYEGASKLLKGQPLRAFDEMGGFMLGSTIVMIFEAPSNFEFKVTQGDKVRVGQTLGEFKP